MDLRRFQIGHETRFRIEPLRIDLSESPTSNDLRATLT